MTMGHGRLLVVLSRSCFSVYLNPCHVLLVHQMMHLELESTQENKICEQFFNNIKV